MRESPFTFHVAKPDEIPEIANFLIEGFREEWKAVGTDWPLPEREPVENELKRISERNGLIKYLNNGVLCGIIGFDVCQPFWWSSKEVLQGVIFYIKPEFRSFNNYSKLLSVAEEFAKINAVPLEMSFFGTDLERKTKALMHRGFKHVSWSVYKNEIRRE